MLIVSLMDCVTLFLLFLGLTAFSVQQQHNQEINQATDHLLNVVIPSFAASLRSLLLPSLPSFSLFLFLLLILPLFFLFPLFFLSIHLLLVIAYLIV